MKNTTQTLEVNKISAKKRILKLLDNHCKEIVYDLLKEINSCSENDCESSINEIFNAIETIKSIQKFKKYMYNNIGTKQSLTEILTMCENNIINQNEEELLCAYLGCGTKVCAYNKSNA